MTLQEIIDEFELYVDDTTELSSQQEVTLANEIYQVICDDRPWEILKKEASGIMTTPTSITIPSDFAHVLENYSYTDNSEEVDTNAKPAVIWLNGNAPFQLVNWSDRRQYVNKNGYCYLDLPNNAIAFPVAQPAGWSYSYDYKFVPPTLGLNDSPVFPARFQKMIAHGMAVDDMIIQLFDKARSNAPDNQAKYNGYLTRMAYWNAQLLNN